MRTLGLLIAAVAAPAAFAGDRIIVQSTSSTQNSGLYDHILPLFEAATRIDAQVVAVGTGQALKNAANCDGDVVVVHARAAEEAFVRAGFGLERHPLMSNDFVIVGPPDDPAGIAGHDAAAALGTIAAAAAPFTSRGDDSGTHSKERVLWTAAGVDPTPASGGWYRETGSGMGATLNAAVAMNAYALTDRATWVAFGNKRDFKVLVEGDPALFNPYGIIAVNPAHCPRTQAEAASGFIDWMLSEEGQSAIAGFKVAGQQLFYPEADR